MPRRKLIKINEFRPIMAEAFQVEGTKLFILELLMYGSAFNSRFVLLKSKSLMEKLADETVQTDLLAHPSKFGKKLELGKGLDYENETRCVYYLPEVMAKDIQ